MGLPVPVFLLVADLRKGELYFASVKSQVRDRFEQFQTQKSFGFKLMQYAEIGARLGEAVFVAEYMRERYFHRFESEVLALLSHWVTYVKFIDRRCNLDAHLGAEDDEEVLFVHIYNTCKFLSQFFRVKWDLVELDILYREDRETFGDPWGPIHYWTFSKVMPVLRAALLAIVESVRDLVVDQQESFWLSVHPLIYRVCLNLDTEHHKRRR